MSTFSAKKSDILKKQIKDIRDRIAKLYMETTNLETSLKPLELAYKTLKNGSSISNDDSEDVIEVKQNEYKDLSVSNAAMAYLSKAKASSTKRLIEALKIGGINTEAKNFYYSLYSILSRRAKIKRDIKNVKGTWKIEPEISEKDG